MRNFNQQVPVLGFAAYSGTGKTTLLTQLVPLLKQAGLHLGLIKHAHHSFDIDQPGKDSYRLRHAGVERVMVGSHRRWALMVETPDAAEPGLRTLLSQFPDADLDLILVEGFKHEAFPKIELHRDATSSPWLYPEDHTIIAVATDKPNTVLPAGLPLLDINQPKAIAGFVLQWLNQHNLGQAMSSRTNR